MSLNIPDPQNVLAELSELIPVVYSALDYGALKAREFFEREDESHRMDRALGPNLVRYFTKKALEQAGQDVQDEQDDEQDFELEAVPNNGLCLTCGRYRIRVLKSDAGDLPIPGHSKSRQAFYQQTSFTFTPEGEQNAVDADSTTLNLLILWDINAPYNLGGLYLACPKSGDTTRASVAAHWIVPIPDPLAITVTAVSPAPTAQAEDDLPISLNAPAETGTEDAG